MAKKRVKSKSSRLKSVKRQKAPKPKAKIEIIVRKEVLGEAPVERHFVVADGRKLKSLVDLAKALETMSEEVFRHHVNDIRNDFSNWVNDVFQDAGLSEELAKVKDKAGSEIVLLRKLLKELTQ